MERKYNRGPVISGFTWRPLVVPSVAPNTASTPMLYEYFSTPSIQPYFYQASTLLRLVCRRVASRYPAPGFGSAIQSPCAPYRLRHGVLAISGSGSITRCYDTRTYNIDTREQQEKRSGQCRGNSSRFFRRSRCKFNGRQVGATATSYLDMYSRGNKLLGD